MVNTCRLPNRSGLKLLVINWCFILSFNWMSWTWPTLYRSYLRQKKTKIKFEKCENRRLNIKTLAISLLAGTLLEYCLKVTLVTDMQLTKETGIFKLCWLHYEIYCLPRETDFHPLANLLLKIIDSLIYVINLLIICNLPNFISRFYCFYLLETINLQLAKLITF